MEEFGTIENLAVHPLRHEDSWERCVRAFSVTV
jgi:hypothetical protein